MHFIPDISLWGWGDLWLKVWKKYEKYIVLVRIKGHRLVHFIKQLLLNYNFFHMTLLFNKKEIYFSETKRSSGAQGSPVMPSGPQAASSSCSLFPECGFQSVPCGQDQDAGGTPGACPRRTKGRRQQARWTHQQNSRLFWSQLFYFILF